MHVEMLSLVEALSRKTTKSGPEYMAYLKGIQFAEKFFEFNTLVLEQQLEELKAKNASLQDTIE